MTIEIILIIVLFVLLIALFAMGYVKKRNFNAKLDTLRSELKNGDKVMTDSGLVGEVVDSYIEDEYKYVVLKSGKGDNSGFITVHANAIYYVFGKDDGLNKKTEPVVVKIAPKTVEKTEEKEEDKQ